MGQHMVTTLRGPGDRHFIEKDYGEGCELIGEIKPQLPQLFYGCLTRKPATVLIGSVPGSVSGLEAW